MLNRIFEMLNVWRAVDEAARWLPEGHGLRSHAEGEARAARLAYVPL